MARERRLGLRCFSGQASAVASTADLEPDAIAAFAQDVVAMAKLVAVDPHAGLPDASLLGQAPDDLELADEAGDSIAPEDRVELAARCEKTSLAADERITNSEGGGFAQSKRSIAYGASNGFRGHYRGTNYSLYASPIASQGSEMQSDSWHDRRRAFARLDTPEAIGEIAAQRALRRLGACKVPTQKVPVIFDPVTAASLVGHVASAVNGGAIYRQASFLLGKLGEQIAAPEVNLIDDGLLPGGLASRPFDAEGLPSRRNVVLKDGTLQSYLLDSYAARKLGMESTGNAARSIGDSPSASSTNVYLEPGAHTPQEIIGAVSQGLYVTSLSGFGVNGVTGDYSRGAAGMWVENGQLTHAVEEVTIAGNLQSMLQQIKMIGSDLEFRSSVCAPTLLVDGLTVGGS